MTEKMHEIEINLRLKYLYKHHPRGQCYPNVQVRTWMLIYPLFHRQTCRLGLLSSSKLLESKQKYRVVHNF